MRRETLGTHKQVFPRGSGAGGPDGRLRGVQLGRCTLRVRVDERLPVDSEHLAQIEQLFKMA